MEQVITNPASLLARRFVGQKSGHSVFQVLRGRSWSGGWCCCLFWSSGFFSKVVWLWQNSVPCGNMTITVVPCWLSTRGGSQFLESDSIPCHVLPLSYKDGKICFISSSHFQSLSLGRALSLLRALLIKYGSSQIVSLLSSQLCHITDPNHDSEIHDSHGPHRAGILGERCSK